MTNRERVISAIRHQGQGCTLSCASRTGRVACGFAAPASQGYTPHNIVFTQQMLEKMVKHTGNADYLQTINNHISKVSLTKPQVPVKGRAECFADEFGVIWDKSGVDKDIGIVAETVIKNAAELASYTPPPIDDDFIHTCCRRLVETKADNFAIASVGFSLFERAWALCGMEDLLCYMITEPDAVKSLLAKLTQRNIEKVKIALEHDIDGVLFGDDWGQQQGLIMGKPLWVSIIKSYVADMYRVVKATGRFTAQHSCGDLREILDDLIEIGLDVYQTFQPEIYDLLEYKQKLQGRLAIWGGISTQVHLPFKSPEEIYRITKDTIDILGKGGGYIAAPTHDVPGDVPPENIEAMVRGFISHGV